MAGGRPTTYGPEVLEQAEHYLRNYKEYDDLIPSVEGLALAINRARSTIYKWAEEEDKQQFSDMLTKLNEEQQRILVNNGLGGKFNSAITKLVLTKHGFHDKSLHGITDDMSKLSDDELKSIINS